MCEGVRGCEAFARGGPSRCCHPNTSCARGLVGMHSVIPLPLPRLDLDTLAVESVQKL